jgi:eukaryotic-like serine/threonine-protein kinase
MPTELGPLREAVRGQYSIQRELGRGGMGIVLLAQDERLDRLVALKVLPPTLAANPEIRERFLREARMAAQLSHPHIVPVFSADEVQGFAFFAMGYVDGETLGERIRARGTLPAADVVRVLRETAWALAYAHARGIVHRDVKPDNILIERGTGRAFVSDFGIARAEFNAALTQDGLVLGSVHFMSPEQSAGEPLDGRSDLYALGCIGFLALSGRLPFDSNMPQKVLLAHATQDPPLLRSVAPDVPPALAAVIDQCLRKRADARFATGEALADALGKALESLEHRPTASEKALSSTEAMAVWRRAAELQAEAASRLEARIRRDETRALRPAGSATPEADDAPAVAVNSDAFRLRDVEAAAVEAGISQRYVALALDELRAAPAGTALAEPLSPWRDRVVTRFLGTAQRTLSVSRIIRASPSEVLPAMGRTFQSSPWLLHLRDTLGGHPLDGGVLVFALPDMVSGDYKWTWTRYGVYVPEVRVSLASVAGDSRATEVTMSIDLRRGLTANLLGYSAVTGAMGGGGGVVAAVVAKKALAMVGAALIGPAATGALLAGLAALALSGPLYRWEMRKAADELSAALAGIELGMRAFDLFGTLGDRPLPRPFDHSLGY